MDSPPETPVSNVDFGRAVGVHFTTASRYRTGDRVPSTKAAQRIAEAYDLDANDLLRAIRDGGPAFGHYLRMNVFGPEPGVDVDKDGNEKKEWTK